MSPLEQVLLLGLAVWRVSYMLAREEGPFAMFVRLRQALGAREVMPGLWQADNTPGKLILCPLCLSVWLAAPAALLTLGWAQGWWLLVSWMAITGLSCVVQLRVNRS